jgi:predicted signal transduction protein with EAL and GGDEF domain
METPIAENDSTSEIMLVEAAKQWGDTPVIADDARDKLLIDPEMAGMDIAKAPDVHLDQPCSYEDLRDRIRVDQQMVELQAELRKAKKALALKSMYDALTGALNQGAIVDALHKEMIRASRKKTSTLSIGLCDLDHFSRVNEHDPTHSTRI